MNKQLFGLAFLLSATASQLSLSAEPNPTALEGKPVPAVIPSWRRRINSADTASGSKKVLTQLGLKVAEVAATAGTVALAVYAAGRLTSAASAEAITAAIKAAKPSTPALYSPAIYAEEQAKAQIELGIKALGAQEKWLRAEVDAAQNNAKKAAATVAFDAAVAAFSNAGEFFESLPAESSGGGRGSRFRRERGLYSHVQPSLQQLRDNAAQTKKLLTAAEASVTAAREWLEAATADARAQAALKQAQELEAQLKKSKEDADEMLERAMTEASRALLGDVAGVGDEPGTRTGSDRGAAQDGGGGGGGSGGSAAAGSASGAAPSVNRDAPLSGCEESGTINNPCKAESCEVCKPYKPKISA
jgi:hypothetical protein